MVYGSSKHNNVIERDGNANMDEKEGISREGHRHSLPARHIVPGPVQPHMQPAGALTIGAGSS